MGEVVVQKAVAFIQQLNQEDIQVAGEVAYETAYQEVPVQTGRLQRSITLETEPNKITLYSDVPYAGIQEARRGFFEAGIDDAIDYLRGQGYGN